MLEPRTVEINHLNKRSNDCEENILSKRIKNDTSESDSSISESNSDIEELNTDDFEDDSNISTEQSRYIPVVLNHLSRQSKVFEYNKRKSIDPTKTTDENLNKLRWKLKNSFNRTDLFKEGYVVLSHELFPFYSLCYMVCISNCD